MRVFKEIPTISLCTLLCVCLLLTTTCRKEQQVVENVKYETLIYELDTINLYESGAAKTRQKSSAQFLATLYADMFSKSLSTAEKQRAERFGLAIGDKQLLIEIFVFAAMQQNDPVAPTNSEMRSDIGQFIRETYIRFYRRKPTAREQYHFTQVIQQDADLRPDDIYLAIALSNEYMFY